MLRVDDMIPSAASAHCVTCVARFPCLASTWKAFALWCHNDRVVTWGHPAYGSDSSGVCKRLRKVVQIVASGRAFAAVTSYGSVVTWGLPKMVADRAMVRQQLYDVRSVTAAAQGAFAALRHDGSVVTWGPSQIEGSDADSQHAYCIRCHCVGWVRGCLGRPLVMEETARWSKTDFKAL